LDALVVALFAAGIRLYIGNIKKSLAFTEQGQFFGRWKGREKTSSKFSNWLAQLLEMEISRKSEKRLRNDVAWGAVEGEFDTGFVMTCELFWLW
jgi:hypothetical protein